MLGLTTDPSPHAIGQDSQEQGRNGNTSTELTTRASGAVTGGVSKGEQQQQYPKNSEEAGDAPGTKPGQGNGSIYSRNEAAAIELETLLWRALCDDPASISGYLADDAVMANPLLFGTAETRSAHSEPTLKEALEECEPFLKYKMGEPKVVEIDLMAVAIVYPVTVIKQTSEELEDGGFEKIEGTASSIWRQIAGGDWKLVCN